MSKVKQLAAIMVSDLIGHGNATRSEPKESRQLVEEFILVQKPLVSKHRGRWIGGLDESFNLVSFESSIDAVNCAREIQSKIKTQLSIQLGIHIQLGEIEIEGDNSVNLVSSIESSVKKPGILISEAIFQTLKHNSEMGLAPVEKDPEITIEGAEKELSMDQALLRKLREIIEENVNNEQFGVEDLANEVAMSRSHLHRKLNALTGQSISLYIRGIRLDNAMRLLQKDVATVSEIAYRVGFGSPTYFIKCFHEHFGYPPGEVKKRFGEQLAGGKIETSPVLKESEEEPVVYEVKETWDEDSAYKQFVSIVFTEISGYSSIMSQDEKLGIRLIEANRNFQLPLIEENKGKLLKEFGERTVSSFDKPEDAVKFGLFLMSRVRNHPYLRLKAVIHVGDILFQDNEVYGEGLNITSSLLPMSVPGGIIVSQSVYDKIDKVQDIHTRFLGSINLEQLSNPLPVHAIVNDGLTIPDQIAALQAPKPSAFDALQPYSTQKLIREVFEEMMKFKPSLQKFLIVDEDEDEEVDTRLLAYHLIKSFPWPIGIELRRLFSGSLRQISIGRLEQLSITLNKCIRLLSILLITEWSEVLIRQKGKTKNNLSDSLQELTPNNSSAIIHYIIDEANKNKVTLFVEDIILDDPLKSTVKEACDLLNKFQNSTSLDQDEIKEGCKEIEVVLLGLLKKMACLAKYKMVNIGMIKVHKSRFSEVRFQHYMDLLNSTDAEFKTFEQEMEQFSDSNAVLLLKSIKTPGEFLNLSPLIVDTHHLSGEKEGIPLKKDIFLYESSNNGAIKYSGTEITEDTDLSNLETYPILESEMVELKKILSDV